MTCKNCTRDLPEDSVFCPYCGSKVEQEPVEHTTIVEITPSVTADEATPPIPTKQKKPKKEKKQRGNKKTTPWILLIVFNCLAALSGIVISFYKVLNTIQYIDVLYWRCHNIDPISFYAISAAEYNELWAYYNERIVVLWVAFAIFVLFFVAVCFVNAAICKKKLNVVRKGAKNLPWLCTFLLAALVCGGIVLSGPSRYGDQIRDYQRWVEQEREGTKKQEEEALLSSLLNSSIAPQTPYEVWEYTKRYPETANETVVKIEGYVHQIDNRTFLMGSSYTTKYLVEISYMYATKKEPRLLDGDYVVVVGKPLNVTPSQQRIVLYIYDWKIIE